MEERSQKKDDATAVPLKNGKEADMGNGNKRIVYEDSMVIGVWFLEKVNLGFWHTHLRSQGGWRVG
jgi:hypothetical protein